jgi:hypothetical protein
MPQLDIGPLRVVSTHLDKTGLEYAFTGGAVVNLLLDNPELASVRPTDDVDVIIEVASEGSYDQLEVILRTSGFQYDMSKGAPICRWLLGSIVVDVMPTDGEKLGLNTKWFEEVLAEAVIIDYAHTSLRVVSPLGLLVTKYLTFTERGEGDFFGSHDLEDFLTVIDGRANIVTEVDEARPDFRHYLVQAVQQLWKDPDFQDSLPGHLPADVSSQQRLPLLRDKLKGIVSLHIEP